MGYEDHGSIFPFLDIGGGGGAATIAFFQCLRGDVAVVAGVLLATQ
jgi:hypothetical protein